MIRAQKQLILERHVERKIISALTQCGFYVRPIIYRNGLAGCPDLICIKNNVITLLEVKNPERKGRLSHPKQESEFEMIREKTDRLHIVSTVDEALAVVGAVVNKPDTLHSVSN